MYSENELLPISALQHLIFCERQAALIHVQQLWAENRLTVEGRKLHAKAHDGKSETIDGVKIARGLWLRSLKMGLIGAADVVEFHPNGQVIPVEYKRGKPKQDDCDRVQICAQALCLEEMLNVSIDSGFLFYGQRKRRVVAEFDAKLRDRTQVVANRFRELIDRRETPTAMRQPKCENCSLIEFCLPDAMRLKTGVTKFNDRQWETVLSFNGPLTDDFGNENQASQP